MSSVVWRAEEPHVHPTWVPAVPRSGERGEGHWVLCEAVELPLQPTPNPPTALLGGQNLPDAEFQVKTCKGTDTHEIGCGSVPDLSSRRSLTRSLSGETAQA